MRAKLNVVNEQIKQANPMIFGHFIEFMRDCIDEGMWAQLLKNRGFDRRKDIPAGVVDGNPNIAEGWLRTGYKNTFDISLDSENSLAHDGLSQKIVCYNDYDGYVGVAQNSLHLEMRSYSGYIWLKAETTAKVRVAVKEKNVTFFSVEFDVTDTWQKYEFTFDMAKETENGMLEFSLLGEATLWMDGASLMPTETVDGIWPEVFEHIQALNPPVIRFPGGCFADCYHWLDGVGERDTRPYRMNRHWGGWEDNSFGTDEYMEFCKRVGCEPMICINFGSADAQEAADWVEYCNGSIDTKYGRLRAENGHPEPYGVKYWDVGNETFGEWEIGHCRADEYAERYLEFYEAMKAKDDSIVFMTCGGDGDSYSQDWNKTIAGIIGEKMNAVCLHMYTLKSMEGKKHDNKEVYYAVVGSVEKYAKILQASWDTMQAASENIRLAVTEYNLGTLIDSYREQTLEAAIFVGGMLNLFLRNTEKLSMCNISDLVNGWPGGCVVSKNGHVYGTASYYVMKMYSECGVEKVLGSTLECPGYSVEEQIGNIEPLENVPYVDTTVCVDKQGRTVIFAVNRSMTEDVCLELPYENCQAEITEIWSEKTSDMNMEDNVSILPVMRKEVLSDGVVCLKPHSVNRIILA